MIEIVPLKSMASGELDNIGNRLHSMMTGSPETRHHLNVRGMGSIVSSHMVTFEHSRHIVHHLRDASSDLPLGTHIIRRRLRPVGEIPVTRLLGLVEPITDDLSFHDPMLGRIPLVGARAAKLRAIEPPVEGTGITIWLRQHSGWRFDMDGALQALTECAPDNMSVWAAEPQTALDSQAGLRDSYIEAGFDISEQPHFIRRSPAEPIMLSAIFDYRLDSAA